MSEETQQNLDARELARDLNKRILARLGLGRASHEDVVSACAVLLARHARQLGMRRERLLEYVGEIFDRGKA